MTPKAGDIWRWCSQYHLLVIEYDDAESAYRCLRLESGDVSLWMMATDDEDEGGDWEWIM